MSGATVNCKTMRAALLSASIAGLDVPALMAKLGIDPKELADNDTRFSYELSLDVWRAADESGPGAFGLRAAQAIADDHFDVIDYVMKASKDLAEGMKHLQRYFAIISTASTYVIVDEVDRMRLERRYGPGAQTTIPHLAEFSFACIVLRSRKMAGSSFRPLEVRFSHRRPVDEREHREVFDCPMYFDAGVSSISIDRATMSLPMTGAKPELSRILARHADAMLAALPRESGDPRARTKEAILAGLEGGRSSLADVAKRLGTSARTLQRRLSELGTSHADLLDEARTELAQRYLGERSLSIGEVAFLVGYADVPTFHRAFKRCTQRTPGEHRRSLG
jgi:AraC-like DNA-binding protein